MTKKTRDITTDPLGQNKPESKSNIPWKKFSEETSFVSLVQSQKLKLGIRPNWAELG